MTFEEFTIGPFQFHLKDKDDGHYSLVGLLGGQAILDDSIDKSHTLTEIKARCKEWATLQLASWQTKVEAYQP